MSLSKLNKKAMNGKLRYADYFAAIFSVLFSLYLYSENGLSTTTYWAIAGSVLSILFAIINPSKRINQMMLRKQTGQF